MDEAGTKETPGLRSSFAGKGKQQSKRRSSLRSSFLSLKGLSFRRSDGNKGADINTLRGSRGADFEGYATINRAGNGVVCGCLGGNKDEMKEKTILIKGAYCFVFSKETDPAPKYAISLAHMKSTLQQSSSGQAMHRVTIETSLGDLEWEVGFEKKKQAQQFVTVFGEQAAIGEADEIRKRLGHGNLMNKQKSIIFAEKVALKKVQNQPEKKDNVLMEEAKRVDPMMPGGGYS